MEIFSICRLVLMAFLLIAPGFAHSRPSNVGVEEKVNFDLLQPSSHDILMGREDAPIRVVEYHAVTCPHCGHFSRHVLPKIKETYIEKGLLSYIVREFPVDEQSFKATLIMRCLPKSSVEAFRTLILNSQENWWGKSDYMKLFKKYAALGGMSEGKIDLCISSKTLQDEILHEKLAYARGLNIQAIPTFFVNNTKFEGALSWDKWQKIFNDLLAQTDADNQEEEDVDGI